MPCGVRGRGRVRVRVRVGVRVNVLEGRVRPVALRSK